MTISRAILASSLAICLGVLVAGCRSGTRPAPDVAEPRDQRADSPVIQKDIPPIAPDTMLSTRCVEGWPSFPPADPKPSLSVEAPKILWQKTIPSSGCMPETAFTGKHLGIVAANRLWILDRQGNITGQFQDTESHWAGSGPVAERDGNFLFVASKAFSVMPDGTPRWWRELGQNRSMSHETTTSSNLVLSPDGVLYFAATDDYVYAWRTSDWNLLWKVKGGLNDSKSRPRALLGGVGDMLFAEGANFRTSDGAAFADPVVAQRTMDLGRPLPGGFPTGYADLVENRYYFRSHLVDGCGQLLWSFPNGANESWMVWLAGYHGKYMVDATPDARTKYYYSSDGKPVVGPKEAPGAITAIGADEVAYATECIGSPAIEGELKLHAYSSTIDLQWSLSLGEPCTHAAIVLADDGVLYITRDLGSKAQIEVIAVQTRSPGLAKTGYATIYHNNRRTGWLAPE